MHLQLDSKDSNAGASAIRKLYRFRQATFYVGKAEEDDKQGILPIEFGDANGGQWTSTSVHSPATIQDIACAHASTSLRSRNQHVCGAAITVSSQFPTTVSSITRHTVVYVGGLCVQ